MHCAGPGQSDEIGLSNGMLFALVLSWIGLICVLCYLVVYKGLLRPSRKDRLEKAERIQAISKLDRTDKPPSKRKTRRGIQEPREDAFLDNLTASTSAAPPPPRPPTRASPVAQF